MKFVCVAVTPHHLFFITIIVSLLHYWVMNWTFTTHKFATLAMFSDKVTLYKAVNYYPLHLYNLKGAKEIFESYIVSSAFITNCNL